MAYMSVHAGRRPVLLVKNSNVLPEPDLLCFSAMESFSPKPVHSLMHDARLFACMQGQRYDSRGVPGHCAGIHERDGGAAAAKGRPGVRTGP